MLYATNKVEQQAGSRFAISAAQPSQHAQLHSITFSSSSTGWTPKKGRVAEPGFRFHAPGRGVNRTAPVSVCHHVSTMGHFPPPMTSWYQFQALALMGSPTVPRILRLDRSFLVANLSPAASRALIRVGAV